MNIDNKELLLQHVAKLDEVIKVLKEDIACDFEDEINFLTISRNNIREAAEK